MAKVTDVRSKTLTVTLSDGVERKLRFTLNAMAELEDQYGTVEAAFDKMGQNSIKAVRFVLWAGLMDGSPELTEQQVGGLIDMQELRAITAKLNEAMGADMPEPETEEQGGTPGPNV